MPANTPFPFWRITGGGAGQLEVASGFLPALAYGMGRSFYLFSQEGLSGAGSSLGGEFRIQAADGGNITGNGNETYGGYLYVVAGNGGTTSGDNSPSYGGKAFLYGGNAGNISGDYSYSTGGEVYIKGGSGGVATGLYSYSYGGDVIIVAGSGNDNGGDIIIQSGSSAGQPGSVNISSDRQMVLQTTAGDIILTAAGNVNVIPRTTGQTVASLPAAAAGNQGTRRFVTDSNAASFTAGIGAIVAGGGATAVPVVSDGANWRIG